MRNDYVVILQSACLVAVVRDCLLVAGSVSPHLYPVPVLRVEG